MAKNFQDITNKAYVALAAGYGIEGAFPIDLRTVLPGTTMLEALIHNNMVYEGMLVYIAGTIYICKPKFHSAVWNPDGDIAASKGKYYLDEELTQPITDGTASGTTVYSNMLWYEEYQVTSQQVETATQASKLDHNVVINGKTTNFALNAGEDVTTIDTGLFTPETIEAGTDIDTITHCGFYSYTDADSANNYSLLIEKIGNKLYRTKITIENRVPVVSTSVQLGTQGDSVVWGEWTRLGIGKCITTCTSQSLHATSVGGNHIALEIKIGSTPELWVYSDSTATYPQGYANIHTADGQVFTIAAQSPAIAHPFVVKLKTADDGTRTAAVESLKGNASNFGHVKLSDATDSESGANGGVAATPKAVSTIQSRLTTHADTKGNANNFGHVKLSDATDSESGANGGVAATPKAVALVKSGLELESRVRQDADSILNTAITNEATTRANADNGMNTRIATAEAKLTKIPAGIIVMWSGSQIPSGWALCNGANGTPDLRDRFIVGSGHEYSIGNTGGSKQVTLAIADMPAHTHGKGTLNSTGNFTTVDKDRTQHSMVSRNGQHDYGKTTTPSGAFSKMHKNNEDVSRWSAALAGGGADDWGGEIWFDWASGATGSTGSAGGGQPHENRPPYYALAFIMFLG